MNMPQNAAQAAQQLGYPSSLFDFTPEQYAYWHEPGLPWLLPGQELPLGYNGQQIISCGAELRTDSMAPRFPLGCCVNIAPVYERQNLVVGRVYAYFYTEPDTGKERLQIGRLVKIGGNVLWAQADNRPGLHLCWLLREEEPKAVWDVYEVTHYTTYPALP